MKCFYKGNKKYILGIFVISVLLFLPMFLNPYYQNGDTLYHVANISSMVQVIQNDFLMEYLKRSCLSLQINLDMEQGYFTHLLLIPSQLM